MQNNNCCGENKPADHSKELIRINRILGQIEGVKKMIESNRYCPDILIQLKAVRSAIRAVENNIFQTHLYSCVVESFNSEADKNKKIDEIKDLFDKFGA